MCVCLVKFLLFALRPSHWLPPVTPSYHPSPVPSPLFFWAGGDPLGIPHPGSSSLFEARHQKKNMELSVYNLFSSSTCTFPVIKNSVLWWILNTLIFWELCFGQVILSGTSVRIDVRAGMMEGEWIASRTNGLCIQMSCDCLPGERWTNVSLPQRGNRRQTKQGPPKSDFRYQWVWLKLLTKILVRGYLQDQK